MGELDERLAQPVVHRCDPLEPLEWDLGSGSMMSPDWVAPRIIKAIQPGARYHCECGQVWVLRQIPGGSNRHISWTERREWHPETRIQRWVRLWRTR